MSIGQRLRAYIEKSGRKQADVAVSWLEAWRKQGRGRDKDKDKKEDTIISQLNRCLQDSPQGVRFFFSNRERGVLLFDTLEIPAEEREPLFELASRALSAEVAPPQVLIDAPGWPGEVSHNVALFEAIERQLISGGPFPMVLLMLEDQFRHLPRSFDEYKDKDQLRFEKVKTVEDGWARVQELAEEQGLVVSRRRFPDFERWLATSFNGKSLEFEPSDGLKEYSELGRLPPLPEVLHDLSSLVPPGQERRQVPPDDPRDLRRLMVALSSESTVVALNLPATARQDLALTLGITATSTLQERREAEIAAFTQSLSIPLKTVALNQLEEIRSRGARRGLEPTVLRVGDIVHLLNVDEALADRARGYEWARVEHVSSRPTPLARLVDAVREWTEDDYLFDPLLEQLIERLDPMQVERRLFLHARAGLLLNHALSVKSAPLIDDWRPALQMLISEDPPEALVRVGTNGGRLSHGHGDVRVFAVPGAYAERAKAERALHQLEPMGDILVRRGEQVVAVRNFGSESSTGRNYSSFLVAQGAEAALDNDLWLDLSDTLPGEWSLVQSVLDRHRGRVMHARTDSWATTELTLDEKSWVEADRELALVWMALRRACADAPWIRLPDKAVLLQVTAGIFAEIRVTRRSEPAPEARIQASLLRSLCVDSYSSYPLTLQLEGIRTTIPTHGVTGTGYGFGPSLLREIHLRGSLFNARIRFHGSALFELAPARMAAAAAAAMKQHDSDEADEAARRDDDDDD
ncbi:hypothetical protein ACLESO_16035 [Pyxidicoccus sp. 3LG]